MFWGKRIIKMPVSSYVGIKNTLKYKIYPLLLLFFASEIWRWLRTAWLLLTGHRSTRGSLSLCTHDWSREDTRSLSCVCIATNIHTHIYTDICLSYRWGHSGHMWDAFYFISFMRLDYLSNAHLNISVIFYVSQFSNFRWYFRIVLFFSLGTNNLTILII